MNSPLDICVLVQARLRACTYGAAAIRGFVPDRDDYAALLLPNLVGLALIKNPGSPSSFSRSYSRQVMAGCDLRLGPPGEEPGGVN